MIEYSPKIVGIIMVSASFITDFVLPFVQRTVRCNIVQRHLAESVGITHFVNNKFLLQFC